jgi:hypothetical protein
MSDPQLQPRDPPSARAAFDLDPIDRNRRRKSPPIRRKITSSGMHVEWNHWLPGPVETYHRCRLTSLWEQEGR